MVPNRIMVIIIEIRFFVEYISAGKAKIGKHGIGKHGKGDLHPDLWRKFGVKCLYFSGMIGVSENQLIKLYFQLRLNSCDLQVMNIPQNLQAVYLVP